MEAVSFPRARRRRAHRMGIWAKSSDLRSASHESAGWSVPILYRVCKGAKSLHPGGNVPKTNFRRTPLAYDKCLLWRYSAKYFLFYAVFFIS
jgi:hypothetical protein